MTKKGFVFGVIIVITLILLFLASSTDLLIKEKKSTVYEVSVLVDSADDSALNNFKSGMDAAALKYNVDLSFVTLYEDNQPWQQPQLLAREISGGAQGVIISAENPNIMEAMLNTIPVNIPGVVYGTALDSPRVKATVKSDTEGMSDALANKIFKENNSASRITIVTTTKNMANIEEICQGLTNQLTSFGFEVSRTELASLEECKTLADGLIAQGKNIVVSPEPKTVEALAEAIDGQTDRLPLYGMGWSSSLWQDLQANKISGLAVSNDFASGYIAVQNMAEILQNQVISTAESINYSVIDSSTLYSKDNQYMLFPVY